ncbi:cyclase family protein [Brevibacillus fluminis]|uniref:Kynurenine formamidase n=1 Tax=Brevibacillus fluminis TaxID=511487 RepID=A0A3M8DI69_9BACL|nr:cyclase family protein [Brevibacillus fluminis]RNB87716.1 cyclase family protein [Brevibacillus fluminis]
MKIYDITMTISAEMPCFPGEQQAILTYEMKMEDGSIANVSTLTLGTHTGTHVDTPLHFIADGKPIDQFDAGAYSGRCYVIDLSHVKECITKDDLIPYEKIVEASEIVLFKTRNSQLLKLSAYQKDHVFLDHRGAEYLVGKGIKAVGIDYLSIEGFFETEGKTHLTLLTNNVLIIEGVDLSEIQEGEYELICLPLKVKGAEGAPARAVLIKRG